jgi:alginate O-acetyltransferase complex protein AlgI
MLFTELSFLPFLLAALAVHWALPSSRLRKVWLLVCSYAFYAAWDWRFLSLIWFSTLVDYGVGLGLARTERLGPRKLLIAASLTANLGLLGVFKYAGFFVDSAVRLADAFGTELSTPTLSIVLPVGISFYTFQTLSYSIDIYRRQLEPTRDLLDLALFVGFFPQLVAGPIVRAQTFLPQLSVARTRAHVHLRSALTLFLIGYVQKAVVADGVAPIVDAYFAEPALYDGVSAWLGSALYGVQIYGDFCGYSNMAIATAGLFGYRLAVNFDFPYFAASVAEFWRRWHISLSTWFRDYLYIPLGGNRAGPLRASTNLMVTMLVAGLWHGAAWNFVVWGGLHGLALGAQRAWVRLRGGSSAGVPRPLGVVFTTVFVVLAWTYFRAQSLGEAWSITQAQLSLGGGERTLGDRLVWVLVGLWLVHWVSRRGFVGRAWARLPDGVFALAYGAAWALALRFSQVQTTPFIYFQF